MPEPARIDQYATKQDLAALRAELRADLAEFKAEIHKDLKGFQTTLIFWIAAMLIVQYAGIYMALTTLTRAR